MLTRTLSLFALGLGTALYTCQSAPAQLSTPQQVAIDSDDDLSTLHQDQPKKKPEGKSKDGQDKGKGEFGGKGKGGFGGKGKGGFGKGGKGPDGKGGFPMPGGFGKGGKGPDGKGGFPMPGGFGKGGFPGGKGGFPGGKGGFPGAPGGKADPKKADAPKKADGDTGKLDPATIKQRYELYKKLYEESQRDAAAKGIEDRIDRLISELQALRAEVRSKKK